MKEKKVRVRVSVRCDGGVGCSSNLEVGIASEPELDETLVWGRDEVGVGVEGSSLLPVLDAS